MEFLIINNMKNNDTQTQIVRQSSLKSAIDFFKVRGDYKPSLMEIVGVSMGFEEYAMSGSYETLKKVQEKLDKQSSDKEIKRANSEFDSIEEALEVYWDPSVNPYGSYEIDYELQQNEQKFCENNGFEWEEWQHKKSIMNSTHFK